MAATGAMHCSVPPALGRTQVVAQGLGKVTEELCIPQCSTGTSQMGANQCSFGISQSLRDKHGNEGV